MIGSEREFLLSICHRLERRFPFLVAAFDGFTTPYLGGERDGFLVVEVFRVPDDRLEEVLIFAESLVSHWVSMGGRFVTFSLWSPQETRKHFQREVSLIELGRLSAWLPNRPETDALSFEVPETLMARSRAVTQSWSFGPVGPPAPASPEHYSQAA